MKNYFLPFFLLFLIPIFLIGQTISIDVEVNETESTTSTQSITVEAVDNHLFISEVLINNRYKHIYSENKPFGYGIELTTNNQGKVELKDYGLTFYRTCDNSNEDLIILEPIFEMLLDDYGSIAAESAKWIEFDYENEINVPTSSCVSARLGIALFKVSNRQGVNYDTEILTFISMLGPSFSSLRFNGNIDIERPIVADAGSAANKAAIPAVMMSQNFLPPIDELSLTYQFTDDGWGFFPVEHSKGQVNNNLSTKQFYTTKLAAVDADNRALSIYSTFAVFSADSLFF